MPDDETRRAPSDAAIRRALAGWVPPMPFTLVIEYDPAAGRPPDRLWVTEFLSDPSGHKLFLAVGPSGVPLPPTGLIRAMRQQDGEAPDNASTQLVLGADWAGRTVFKPPQQNAN